MFTTEMVFDKKEVENLIKRLIPDHEPPNFLFNEKKYKRMVMAMKKDGAYVGLAYGVVKHGSPFFILHLLYIEKEWRKFDAVIFLLESLLKAAIELEKAKAALWGYSLNEGEEDFRQRLIKKIGVCKTYDIEKTVNYKIKTSRLHQIKKFTWCKKINLSELGYDFINWSDFSADMQEAMRSKEDDERKRNRYYLSPFVDEEELFKRPLDEMASFVLVKKGTKEPMGWIISQRYSETAAKLTRFYIYKEERTAVAAPFFFAYAADVISRSYEELYFDIDVGNRQMERFMHVFFEPVLELNYIQHVLRMHFVYN